MDLQVRSIDSGRTLGTVHLEGPSVPNVERMIDAAEDADHFHSLSDQLQAGEYYELRVRRGEQCLWSGEFVHTGAHLSFVIQTNGDQPET